ncbi:MAG: M23 family metallopeptidase [Tyzzerella sp.]|nr:M23 family metallopeptidase [Tyzzerella sp.]
MRNKKLHNLIILVFLSALFTELWIMKLVSDSRMERLSTETVTKQEYRDQEIGEDMLAYIMNKSASPEEIGLYLLESKFGYQTFPYQMNETTFQDLKDKWKWKEGWSTYVEYTEAIWNDLKYFPVPESTTDSKMTVSFTNSWMAERTYGGKRGHEGTDLMAAQNIAGIYPIVSMTNGIVRSKGWLEKGGYRIGIEAPSGAYFYYAHLDSYASIEIGDKVKAGDLLGFMGDSGYGEEGTTGMFPVHLHVGVYIYPNETETSINPYWLLRYLENQKVKCAYSCGDIE